VNLAKVIQDLCQAAEAGDWSKRQRLAQRAALIESQLEDREAFLVSNDMSVRDVFAMFRNVNDRLERDWEKNFQALFGDWSIRLARRNPPQPQPTVCIPFL
jgi:glutathione S-transferase